MRTIPLDTLSLYWVFSVNSLPVSLRGSMSLVSLLFFPMLIYATIALILFHHTSLEVWLAHELQSASDFSRDCPNTTY